jgi:alpha-beta hydrolase superfamily lysophospholipase
MRVLVFIRLLCGFSIGAILTALLAWAAYPSDSPAVILSWPLAGVIGWLASSLANRFGISVAGLSAVAGSAAPIVVEASIQWHPYLLLHGGPYVLYALLGSLATLALREDWENSSKN